MPEEVPDKSFVIKDRRSSTAEPSEGGEARQGSEVRSDDSPRHDDSPPMPEASFLGLLYSLHTSALMALGEIADPHLGDVRKDLTLARHSIDLLGILKAKTRGNLDPDEEKILENILYDLRMRFVQISTGTG